jgi:serine/threonine-protein kinase RsbW
MSPLLARGSLIRIRIDSRFEEAALVGMVVNTVCTFLHMNEVDAYQVELCAVEAVNNVIRHSYHGQAGHPVDVAIHSWPVQVRIDVLDRGSAMPSEELKHQLDRDYEPTDRSSLPERGLGIPIINAVMDEVSYGRSKDRNRLSLVKLLK